MSPSSRIVVVGLGPDGLDLVPSRTLGILLDPERVVVVRTLRHPAARELAERREIVACDDLYEAGAALEDVYAAIVRRVLDLAAEGPVAYAVPGSAAVGERAVALLRAAAAGAGVPVEVVPGVSFLELAFVAVGLDPLDAGVQVLDGRALPDPVDFAVPTFVTQVDTRLVLSDVAVAMGRILPDDAPVTVLRRLGGADAEVSEVPICELPRVEVDERTTLYVPAHEVGWIGLVRVNRVLRERCPWDREQTHHSLLSHLVEEAFETVDAIASLPVEAPRGEPDLGAYAEVEEELGDLLLQVVFHATLAREAGAFDVEEVAEGVRRKLVRRHPHVFGSVEVSGPQEVLANWEELKGEEKARASLMDGLPSALPGIARADKIQRRAATVGFDWPEAAPVFDKVAEELNELRGAVDAEARTNELGDLLFAVVNLARHLGLDPEAALARANDRFVRRFRRLEELAAARRIDLRSADLATLDRLWDEAKAEDG